MHNNHLGWQEITHLSGAVAICVKTSKSPAEMLKISKTNDAIKVQIQFLVSVQFSTGHNQRTRDGERRNKAVSSFSQNSTHTYQLNLTKLNLLLTVNISGSLTDNIKLILKLYVQEICMHVFVLS